jgi:hypothetical protein
MADLAKKPHTFLSLQTAVFICWLVGEGVAMKKSSVDPLFIVASGSLILAGALWIADGFQTELVLVKRESETLSDGSPKFARRTWAGLRRRTSDPIEPS